ncbi:ATPase [candidate division KSB1 bacterium]|nr:ATPase [candidate division KSB1 bacterium]RQW09649.1 MAG: ATPase [candidate division KSB1 bacterium]
MNIRTSLIVLAALLCITGAVFSTDVTTQEDQQPAEGTQITQISKEQADVSKIALIAAAIAFAAGALAAGFAISHVGAAAMGAVAEKPEIGGQALIFIALAEGLVVFGFITALMILGKM